ncbi:MAG: hypothetical protein WD942_07605 [Dehalococcoidia bacterium]
MTMKQNRETPGAIRYHEVDAKGQPIEFKQAKIGQLYIRKTGLGGANPDLITVTIEHGPGLANG